MLCRVPAPVPRVHRLCACAGRAISPPLCRVQACIVCRMSWQAKPCLLDDYSVAPSARAGGNGRLDVEKRLAVAHCLNNIGVCEQVVHTNICCCLGATPSLHRSSLANFRRPCSVAWTAAVTMAFSAAHMQQLGTGLCKHSSRSRASLSVHARFGGRDSGLILGPGGNNYGDQNQKAKEARLILPGQQRQTPSRGPQRLIQPEQQRPGGRPGGENFLPDDSTLGLVGETQNLVGGPPTLNKYRPPAGFMNDTLPEDSTANMEPQDMLNRLRSRAGHWHELAKLFPALNSKGFDSATIDEMTGITPAEQNKWMVAATVYESVQASAAVPRETLARFNGEGYDLLYPFRFLSAERRAIAAQYIVEQGLDAPVSWCIKV